MSSLIYFLKYFLKFLNLNFHYSFFFICLLLFSSDTIFGNSPYFTDFCDCGSAWDSTHELLPGLRCGVQHNPCNRQTSTLSVEFLSFLLRNRTLFFFHFPLQIFIPLLPNKLNRRDPEHFSLRFGMEKSRKQNKRWKDPAFR